LVNKKPQWLFVIGAFLYGGEGGINSNQPLGCFAPAGAPAAVQIALQFVEPSNWVLIPPGILLTNWVAREAEEGSL